MRNQTTMTTDAGSFSQSNSRAVRNPWVIGWITLVVIVLAVNITMITLAVTTNPGLVDKDYYEKGRNFERNVHKQIAARNALGWEGHLDISDDLHRNNASPIRFSVVDDKGLPLSNLKVTLINYRPSDANADFTSVMKEFSPGQYAAEIKYPLKGLWETTLRVEHDGQPFDMVTRRIDVIE